MDEKRTNTVYLVGDSITQGLGSKRVNFTKELQDILGASYEVINLAYTGTTISYANELIAKGAIVENNDNAEAVCVILYGNVDAQIRPNSKGRVYPWIPKRFRGGGMLMPRPFYSRNLCRRFGQVIDNLLRKLFAQLIIMVDGTEQWVSLDSFAEQYNHLISTLIDMNIFPIACSCVYIDDRLFAGSQQQYELFSEQIHSLAHEHRVPFIDFFSQFRAEVNEHGWDSVYNKDHFHPNGKGYHLMAGHIAQTIMLI